MCGQSNNIGLGRLVNVKEVNLDNNNSTISNGRNNDNDNDDKDNELKVQNLTRTIKISEHTYRRIVAFSKKNYNIESYETILSDLLDCYQKHNPDTYWHDNNTS